MNLMQYRPVPEVERAMELVNGKDTVKVLFVCLGNICRSPAAEGVMKATVKDDDGNRHWIIDSAGTGDYHIGDLPDRRMRVHARERGLTLDHHCRQVSLSDFSDFDLIFGMDSRNVANLQRMAPDDASREKVLPIGVFLTPGTVSSYVPDPYYGGASDFELVLDLLDDACRNLRDTVEGKS